MCQQKGFKLRFVCAKKHTTARVEKKNVSVSLRGKKTDSAVLFSCFLNVCYLHFRNARVLMHFSRQNAECGEVLTRVYVRHFTLAYTDFNSKLTL